MIMHWGKCNLKRQVRLSQLREIGARSQGELPGKHGTESEPAKAGMASTEEVTQAKWQNPERTYIFWNIAEARPDTE